MQQRTAPCAKNTLWRVCGWKYRCWIRDFGLRWRLDILSLLKAQGSEACFWKMDGHSFAFITMVDLFIAHLWTVCWLCKDAWNVTVIRAVRWVEKHCSFKSGQWAENATSTNGILLNRTLHQPRYHTFAYQRSSTGRVKSHIPVNNMRETMKYPVL